MSISATYRFTGWHRWNQGLRGGGFVASAPVFGFASEHGLVQPS